jgi:thiamine-phosphate pyrophosphorylase
MDKRIFRVIDANFNRSKEGLRVTEDIFRFILEDDKLRKKIRNIRHSLDSLAKDKIFEKTILSRDSKKDLGRNVDALEIKRKNSIDVLYINFQRVKESLRVIEEFFKIINPDRVEYIKKLRYKIYTIEKNARVKYPSI